MQVTKCKINPSEISLFGLTSPTTWEVYELIDNPGFKWNTIMKQSLKFTFQA